MFTSWRLGRIFGFPVEINLSFVLLLAVVFVAYSSAGSYAGLMGVLGVGILFASVLVHELGHALVARRLGVHVSGIELSFFGGAAKMVQMPRSANHEIAIAAAGPAVSLMLAGIGLGLGSAADSPLIAQIGWINLVLAAFNLIPALPMDGGRILRALLTRRMDFVRATDLAVTVARVVAVGFVLFGLAYGYYQLVVLAPLLWIMGSQERMLARTMVNDYAGDGRGGFGRPDWFSRSRPSGGHRGWDYPGSAPEIARFTVRQVGGRLVIERLD